MLKTEAYLKMSDCDRCGGDFRVAVCVVHEGDVPAEGVDRERIEAELCYDCQQDIPNRKLGAAN